MSGFGRARPHQRVAALIRLLFALLGGLGGALLAAPLLAIAGAFIATEIYGAFEGAAAMGGGWLGAVAGLVLGFAGGIWLVLRRNGQWAGPAVAWLWVGAIVVAVCFGFVAFSG